MQCSKAAARHIVHDEKDNRVVYPDSTRPPTRARRIFGDAKVAVEENEDLEHTKPMKD